MDSSWRWFLQCCKAWVHVLQGHLHTQLLGNTMLQRWRKLEKTLFRLFILSRQKATGDWGPPPVVAEMGTGVTRGQCCRDVPIRMFLVSIPQPFCPTQGAVSVQVDYSIARLLGTYDRHLPHTLNILDG